MSSPRSWSSRARLFNEDKLVRNYSALNMIASRIRVVEYGGRRVKLCFSTCQTFMWLGLTMRRSGLKEGAEEEFTSL